MNRRAFLRGLFATGALVALEPEKIIFDVGRNLWRTEPQIFDKYAGWDKLYVEPCSFEYNTLELLDAIRLSSPIREVGGRIIIEPLTYDEVCQFPDTPSVLIPALE